MRIVRSPFTSISMDAKSLQPNNLHAPMVGQRRVVLEPANNLEDKQS